jgi:chromosome segregation ATPase
MRSRSRGGRAGTSDGAPSLIDDDDDDRSRPITITPPRLEHSSPEIRLFASEVVEAVHSLGKKIHDTRADVSRLDRIHETVMQNEGIMKHLAPTLTRLPAQLAELNAFMRHELPSLRQRIEDASETIAEIETRIVAIERTTHDVGQMPTRIKALEEHRIIETTRMQTKESGVVSRRATIAFVILVLGFFGTQLYNCVRLANHQ